MWIVEDYFEYDVEDFENQGEEWFVVVDKECQSGVYGVEIGIEVDYVGDQEQ